MRSGLNNEDAPTPEPRPASPLPEQAAVDAIAEHLMDCGYVVWAGKTWKETPDEYYRNVFRDRARKILATLPSASSQGGEA